MDDRAHRGERVVRGGYPDSTSAFSARLLAELGDFSPLDSIYTRWQQPLTDPERIYDSSIVFYLPTHGERREWELLHRLAQNEIAQKPGSRFIWVLSAVVSSGKAKTFPLQIPRSRLFRR